jgi:ribose transport system substrate-binding protein
MLRHWGHWLTAWGICLLLLAGCGGGSGGDSPTATGGSGSTRARYRIAVIPKGTTHDFWLSVHHGAEQAAQELGNVEILWDGPASERDKDGQIKLIESFLLKQVDGVCLAPIDRDALVPVVRRCRQRDIPVVIFDSGLSDPDSYISYVATDNYKGGTMAGERMVELLEGKGNVIMLPYQEGSESTEQREQGFLDVIAKHPDINVLSADQRVGSDAEEALRISSSLLVQYGDKVDGIFTVCEPLNKGMLKALEDRGMAGKVKFVGFDSDPRFVAALREKKMHGIVLQDPVNMGYTAVKTMVAHLEGEDVPDEISTGEALATPENMSEEWMSELLHPPKFGHK